MKIFSNNYLSAKDCQNQRIYIYNNLNIILASSTLELIWPINQLIDPLNKKQKGFCHGYGEVWSNYLVTQDSFTDTRAYINWQELTSKSYFDLNSMPLDRNIIQAQRVQTCGPNKIQKSRITNASISKDCADLIDKIFAKIEFFPCQLYIIDLAKMDSTCNLFFRYYPGLKKRWHEIRIYIDKNHKLHWFDANLGWLRTKSAFDDPTILDYLKRDIFKIFYLLGYHEKYQIMTLSLKLDCQKKLRII